MNKQTVGGIEMNYLMEEDDSALDFISSWRRWAFIDYRND